MRQVMGILRFPLLQIFDTYTVLLLFIIMPFLPIFPYLFFELVLETVFLAWTSGLCVVNHRYLFSEKNYWIMMTIVSMETVLYPVYLIVRALGILLTWGYIIQYFSVPGSLISLTFQLLFRTLDIIFTWLND